MADEQDKRRQAMFMEEMLASQRRMEQAHRELLEKQRAMERARLAEEALRGERESKVGRLH